MREIINWVQEKGWYILNDTSKGDWEREYTYVGARGSSVIDYALVNEKMYDRLREFRIGERIESDHMPLMVEIGTDIETEGKGSSQEEEENKKKRR